MVSIRVKMFINLNYKIKNSLQFFNLRDKIKIIKNPLFKNPNTLALNISKLTNKLHGKTFVNASNCTYGFMLKMYTIWLNKNKINSIFLITTKDSFTIIRNLLIVFVIDTLVTDDEPLWEPIEWSLIQTWLLFIFLFSWAVENLISSRYGSYTGRDKRVWLGLYKAFWFIEIWLMINLGVTCILIISPFYFEINYLTSCIVLWWNWYNVLFFFKYTSYLFITLLIVYTIQLGFNWLSYTKILLLYLLLILLFFYLLFTSFYITFFSYFTNVASYQTYKPNNLVQLSQSSNKWGWGPLDRDHFTHHRTTLSFWYKNDSPYAYAMFLLNNFFFISLFLIFLQLVIGIRFIYSVKHSNYNFITYINTLIKHFLMVFLYFNIFIFFSILFQWMRISYDFSIYYNYQLMVTILISYVQDIGKILLYNV